MSLNKEWFEKRDQFIAQQKELGSFTLKESLEELDKSMHYFFDLGILSQRDFTTTTTNCTQLTALGELFYVDKYQQIFITPENLKKLKQALKNWDNFTVDYPMFESGLVGEISVRNQKHVAFKVRAGSSRHRMTFRMNEARDPLSIFGITEGSPSILKVWNDFNQCVTLIENDEKAPTNIEIATDPDAIETLSSPWHPLVQRYFRGNMHELGFENNLRVLKNEIESTYSVPSSKWQPIISYFDMVRPPHRTSQELQGQGSENEAEVELISPRAINQFGLVDPQLIEPSLQNTRNLQRYSMVKPGDVLMYKSPADRKTVKVAYYPIECSQEYLCSEMQLSILRVEESGNWDGKRLFLFLNSIAGQKLLEYTFRYFSPNEMARMSLMPRQLSRLEVPELEQKRASELDDKYIHLTELITQRLNIEEQISSLMQQN